MLVRRAFQPGRLPWLALALLGLLAGIPDVRAGCGSHVQHLAHRGDIGLIADLDRIQAGLVPASPAGRVPGTCTGPTCSRPTGQPLGVTIPDRTLPEPCLYLCEVKPTRAAGVGGINPHPCLTHAPPPIELPERPPRP